ncbi:ABC transporter substrate-binding protein [Candidatus Woesearchaeota archaeon]|nr:ABC transporter substrate-binding protein [Candidatus Woesearchaeota archaeon]
MRTLNNPHLAGFQHVYFILCALLLLGACASTQEAQPVVEKQVAASEKILLGAMMPLTGDGAAYGVPILDQIKIAVDAINAQGGIDGKVIELVVEDSKCNAKDGATAATKLVDVDKVPVIFGGACSGETLGAAPIVEKAKVVLISPSASSPDITNAGDYVFRTNPSDAFGGKIAAEHALKQGHKKAAIIHETSDYAQALRRVFDNAFTQGGGEIVETESFGADETDFKTQILKVKEATPDMVYVVPQTPAKGVLLMKQLREQGFTAPIFTDAVLIGRDVVKEYGAEMEGLTGVEPYFDEKGEIASKALGTYRELHGEPPWPFYQSAGRDAVYLIADAIGKVGLDATKIKDELYKTKNFPGALGLITLDSNGDLLSAYSVKQIKDGTLLERERTS